MHRAIAIAAAAALTTAVAAAPASAATPKHTYRLYSKEVTSTIYAPDGSVRSGAPLAGDRLVFTDDDYAGTKARHSKKPVGSDHLSCTILDPATGSALCDGQIALKGGMILADHQQVDFSAPALRFSITGGTGIFKKVKGGTLVANNDSDLTISLKF